MNWRDEFQSLTSSTTIVKKTAMKSSASGVALYSAGVAVTAGLSAGALASGGKSTD
jgi:hypothetical protein